MGKTVPDAVKGTRKRTLSVIYFVDSARTRSFQIPLMRLNVVLFALLGMMTWSVASVFLIVWLGKGQEDLSTRLRQSLATVFEYETRYDDVYDVAYPPASKTAPAQAQPVAAAPQGAKPAAPQAPSTAELAEKLADGGGIDALKKAANQALAAKVAADKAAATKPAPASMAKAEEPAGADAEPETGKGAEPAVVVGNPVLESKSNALQLDFDLTSKSTNDRVEGYIYAVAELTTDKGEKLYIGAPSEIQVKEDGEPRFPLKSALFGIKRYKKKSFSFPLEPGRTGIVTRVKIGVMDRSGSSKSTYNVPVEIRVGDKG